MQAILALEDGSTFSGQGFGAPGVRVGQVVFNTAMTGYQELLTDPSSTGQIVLLTAAHVGNTGVNAEDNESEGIHAAGLVVRDYPRRHSSWRASGSLSGWMAEGGLPGIAGVDTRAVTRRLRESGPLRGCLVVGESVDADSAVERARSAPGEADNLSVGTSTAYDWSEGSWDAAGRSSAADRSWHVVCVDFGIKRGILRQLHDAGCRVSVVPSNITMDELAKMQPDGVLLSNGPGHPQQNEHGVRLAGQLISQGLPVFGICLGHQLLGLACGARVIELRPGHRGANHPVKVVDSGRAFISSQNHGFALDEGSLPASARVTYRSLFDGSVQGIRLEGKPVMGFQGHPEASPGPHDVRALFSDFVAMMADAES